MYHTTPPWAVIDQPTVKIFMRSPDLTYQGEKMAVAQPVDLQEQLGSLETAVDWHSQSHHQEVEVALGLVVAQAPRQVGQRG